MTWFAVRLTQNRNVSSLSQQQQLQEQHIKRSLCNTFGGCGAKRSIQPGYRNIVARNGPDLSDRDAAFQRKQEANALSIAEIINDLLDYMQMNENYNRGKYAFMVSKPSKANGAPQVNEGASQELQVGHIYFGRTE